MALVIVFFASEERKADKLSGLHRFAHTFKMSRCQSMRHQTTKLIMLLDNPTISLPGTMESFTGPMYHTMELDIDLTRREEQKLKWKK